MKKTFLVIIILAVVAGIIIFMMQNNSSTSPESATNASTATSTDETATESTVTDESTVAPTTATVTVTTSSGATQQVKSATITYTDTGYQPSSITVDVGTKVTFINQSSRAMWTASGPHPSHTLHPEFDALRGYAKGESYSFTFTKAGDWPFHNHLKASAFGRVTVR